MSVKKTEQKARIIPEGMKQVNFNLSAETVKEVQRLAKIAECKNSVIYRLAVERYVEQYKGKAGKVLKGVIHPSLVK